MLSTLNSKSQVEPDTVLHDFDEFLDFIDWTIIDGFYYPNRAYKHCFHYIPVTTTTDTVITDTINKDKRSSNVEWQVFIELHDPVTNNKGDIEYYVVEMDKKMILHASDPLKEGKDLPLTSKDVILLDFKLKPVAIVCNPLGHYDLKQVKDFHYLEFEIMHEGKNQLFYINPLKDFDSDNNQLSLQGGVVCLKRIKKKPLNKILLLVDDLDVISWSCPK